MTDEPLAATWGSRELPILRAALRRLDAGEDFPGLEDIRAEVGLDVAQMRAGVKALERSLPPYVEITHLSMGAEAVGGHVDAVSERARRELGTWPSPGGLVDQLAHALAQAAEHEVEPERRSRLRAGGEALAGFGRDIAVGVISAHLG